MNSVQAARLSCARCALIALPFFVLPYSTAPAQENTAIAVIAPLSGPFGILGAEIFNAVKLFEQSPQGKSVSVITCDDAVSAESGRQCVDLARKEKRLAGIIGAPTIREASGLRDYTASHSIPFISLAAERPAATQRPRTYFRIGTTVGQLVSGALQFSEVELKARRMYVLDPGVLSQGRKWSELVKAAKVESRSVAPTTFARLNMSELGIPQGTDVVVMPAAALPRIIGDISRLPYRIVAYSTMGLPQLTTPADNVYVISGFGSRTQPEAAFVENYQKQYGQPPAGGFALPAFAALQIFANAAKASDGRSDRVLSALQARRFETVIGSVQFDDAGNANWSSEHVWKLGQIKAPIAFSGATECKCGVEDCCKIKCCAEKSCQGSCRVSKIGRLERSDAVSAASVQSNGVECEL